jgi:hypothetical protein
LRGDAGLCREKLLAWCESEHIDYIFGLAQNPRLKAETAHAEKKYAQNQASVRVFNRILLRDEKTWSRERRVIAKAEHLGKGTDPRFVVTSLSSQQMAAQELYEITRKGTAQTLRRVALAGAELDKPQCRLAPTALFPSLNICLTE